MLVVVHEYYKVTRIIDEDENSVLSHLHNASIASALIEIAAAYPTCFIVWCHKELEINLNKAAFQSIFHHHRILATFNPTDATYLPEEIGFIERSNYLKINKNVPYPTWMMSSYVGGMHASVIQVLVSEFGKNEAFDYILISIAKRFMPQGLFCYSDPRLLTSNEHVKSRIKSASKGQLFKFTKQHYKWVWVFFMAFSCGIFQKKVLLLPLLKSLFYKKRVSAYDFTTIPLNSTKNVVEELEHTIDVIIPTIGRKAYLYDVLKDLSQQTLVPKTVIIVEQNPLPNAVSELDYLTTESWPFKIKHTFTHQTGVCNARNVALSQVESTWTFLGDDDNRFEKDLLASVLKALVKVGANVGTTVYLQPNEVQGYLHTAQTSIFGAGNSIVKSKLLQNVAFDMRYEFNYGEDKDFGMQLRQIGEDVIYFADIKITHLKAPIGGYRTKVSQLWDNDPIPPKPSPAIQLLHQNYFTKQQLLGYKLLLGLRNYKYTTIKNPFRYVSYFNKQWQRSVYWSTKL